MEVASAEAVVENSRYLFVITAFKISLTNGRRDGRGTLSGLSLIRC